MKTRSHTGRRQTRCGNVMSPVEYALVVFVLLALLVIALVSGRTAPIEIKTERIRIESGDTLWSLAESHPIPGLSTPETIAVLVRLNSLDGSTLHAGTALSVPMTADSHPMGDLAMR